MADYIRVRVATPSNRIVLWERDPEHPNGEISIAGQDEGVYEVARTSAVMQRIQSGDLAIVEDEAEPEEDIGETAEKLNEVLTPKSEKTTRRK